jgi:hypothetical protein
MGELKIASSDTKKRTLHNSRRIAFARDRQCANPQPSVRRNLAQE